MSEQRYVFVVWPENGGWTARVADEVTCAWGVNPMAAIRALCDLLEKEWGAG